MDVRGAVYCMAVGVVGAQLMPPAPAWLAAVTGLAAGGALGLGWMGRSGDRALGGAGRALLGVALTTAAGAVAAWRLAAVLAPVLPPDHVAAGTLPRGATIAGRVAALPVARGTRTFIVVDVEEEGGVPARGRVRLAVRGRPSKVRSGDTVRVTTTLRRPRGFANPGGFDVAGHLARRGVHVIAAAWEPALVVRRSRPPRSPGDRLERWRGRLVRAIARAVPGAEGAVLRALVIGDQSAIPAALRDAFARAGVVHVLSVSGLHVALVGGASWVLLRWLLARSTWLLLRVDVRALAAVASLGPVTGYAALAGLESATVRSALMAAAGVAALLAGRRLGPLRALALAAIALGLAVPGSPREIAFQLSFASVLAIALATTRWSGSGDGWRARIRAGLVVSAAALVGTAPLTALHFGQVAPMALAANPLVVPLCGGPVVGLGLVGAALEPVLPAVAAAAWRVAGVALRPTLAVVETLAAVPGAAVGVPAPSPAALTTLAVLLGALVAPPGCGRRAALAVAAALLVALAAHDVRARWAPERLRLTILDVGQGDAAVAELPNGRVLVVDAGGFPGGDFDPGAAIVAPFLRTRSIARIDALVMTHAHPDHFGGLAALLASPGAAELWWSGHAGRGVAWAALETAIARSGVRLRRLRAGRPLPALAGHGRVLHPPAGWPGGRANDDSVVLRLRLGRVAFLLTGDVEARAERAMLARGARLRADVVKVPHHGSRTSSTPGLVAATGAAVAVIPVGAENRYGHPAPDVTARWRAAGACVLRTDACGAVTLETDGRSLAVTSVRGCGCPEVSTPRP
ncbi:MAG: DNA internalization-related competence protein ComEC/Rec2 [bacterium]|nr:DNA internalization-related competence protein ComEC/Rec2 [bacterium]